MAGVAGVEAKADCVWRDIPALECVRGVQGPLLLLLAAGGDKQLD